TTINLGAMDADGDAMSFTIIRQPANGTVSGMAPNAGGAASLTYRPDPNYSGIDSFEFKVSDGQSTSTAATIEVDVTPVNDAPVATSALISLTEDTSTPVVLRGSDIDGDALTFAVTRQPAHGA